MSTHTAESLAKLLETKFPDIDLDADIREYPSPRFSPSCVASYLCDMAGTSAAVGAIHHYVWAMASAPYDGAARQALRNLAGLIPVRSNIEGARA